MNLKKVISNRWTAIKIKKELTERWTTELDVEINRSLKKENWKDKTQANIRWQHQPFGLTDTGKIDFRGFPFREPSQYQYLVGIDFSYSKQLHEINDSYGMSRGGSFNYSIFEACIFVDTEMPANLSEKFVDCDFSGASFKSSRINGVFESCRFIKSKMNDVIGAMKFVNCDFTGANLSKSYFYNCRFENCIFDNTKFSGSNISGSTFISTRPSDAQIASCVVADKLKLL